MTQLSDFLAKFLAPAQASHAKFYPRGPFVSISLAQTIIESDWGKVSSGTNNYWGIKANADQIAAGQYTTRWTHETINNVYQKLPQNFANYPDLQSGFDAHAHLLTTPWYQRCMDAKTPDDYAHALWLCHYATGIPGHPYDQALIDIMFVNNLYQFDAPTRGVPATPTPAPTPIIPTGWYWAFVFGIWQPVMIRGTTAFVGNDTHFDWAGNSTFRLGPAIPKPESLT